MPDIVIKAENLGKKYIIGHQAQNERYLALRDILVQNARELWRKTKDLMEGNPVIQGDALEEIWVLRDIHFKIERGEVVAIIGRNGAGKSTLLKILSRITEPSAGRVTIKGRVASLLEVGTGFHPELTGRENIYMNGAILGMSRAEIRRKFDEIVTFAEIDTFLDTPVKRYSSGMYVRLAFAVAAHLEPEILLIDEVLAVGDIAFQQKCIGKMGNVAKEGRTVLFVSHNMSAVNRLCERAIWIASGTVLREGKTSEVVSSYISDQSIPSECSYRIEFNQNETNSNEYVRLNSIVLSSSNGRMASFFTIDEGFFIRIIFTVLLPISNFHFYIRIYSEDGILAFCSADWDEGEVIPVERQPGNYSMGVNIPPHLLNHGKYSLHIFGLIPSVKFLIKETNACIFKILPAGGAGGVESVNRQGLFRPMLKWYDAPEEVACRSGQA